MIIKILPIPTATVLYSNFSSISIINRTIQSKISLLIITLTGLSTSKIQIKQMTSGIYSIGSIKQLDINYLIEQVNKTPIYLNYNMTVFQWYKRYFTYVLRHKYYVWKACFSMWLYWQWVLHDLSKFLPSEARRYMRRFSMWDKSVDTKFNEAWLYHQRRNKHHWQYWVLLEDDWNTFALEMPEKYVKEMLCDWRGVWRAFADTEEKIQLFYYCQRHEVYNRYHKRADKMTLHKFTRRYVEDFLEERKRRESQEYDHNDWYFIEKAYWKK